MVRYFEAVERTLEAMRRMADTRPPAKGRAFVFELQPTGRTPPNTEK